MGRRRPAACRHCGHALRRFWRHCPGCARGLIWDDEGRTGAVCPDCGWSVSKSFSHCPWCRADLQDEGSSCRPLKRPRGFLFHARCDHDCGGGVQFPMDYCPWCGRRQRWPYHYDFEGVCPHCRRGVDDRMDHCIWCGADATGRDLLRPAIQQIETLLRKVGVPDWDYRILVRPGVSGVDPRYPKIIEIQNRYARRREGISWPGLVGLLAHELGHSFLFHHWHFARSRRFQRAFGDVDVAYQGVDESWVSFRKSSLSKTPVEYVNAYAATHPLEDFAETFRFYVVRHGELKDLLAEIGRLGKGVIVYEKFLTLHNYIGQLRSKRWSAQRELPLGDGGTRDD